MIGSAAQTFKHLRLQRLVYIAVHLTTPGRLFRARQTICQIQLMGNRQISRRISAALLRPLLISHRGHTHLERLFAGHRVLRSKTAVSISFNKADLHCRINGRRRPNGPR